MKLTQKKVLSCLKKYFGINSYIYKALTNIEFSLEHKTIYISFKTGTIYFNLGFNNLYLKDDHDLFSLIAHELLHKVFSHSLFTDKYIGFVSCDAVINSIISNLFSFYSKNGKLFKNYYENPLMEDMLFVTNLPKKKLGRFETVYNVVHAPKDNFSSTDISLYLHNLIPEKASLESNKIGDKYFLGNHDKNLEEEILPEELGKISLDFSLMIEFLRNIHGSNNWNEGTNFLANSFIKILDLALPINKRALMKYATKKKIDNFKKEINQEYSIITPFPISIKRREAFLLSQNVPILYYKTPMNRKRIQSINSGLVIYLDVSGSVNENLSKILNIFKIFKKEVKAIYLFSDKIWKTTIKNILSTGKIRTTYGTNFNAVAEHINSNGFDSCIVITDGIGSMNEENFSVLKAKHIRILTILFGKCFDLENSFSKFGETIRLEDI